MDSQITRDVLSVSTSKRIKYSSFYLFQLSFVNGRSGHGSVRVHCSIPVSTHLSHHLVQKTKHTQGTISHPCYSGWYSVTMGIKSCFLFTVCSVYAHCIGD